MQLTSSAFMDDGDIPKKYTCEGKNVSPPLGIVDAPEDAQSFALIVSDPDAPGGDFVHWILWNIDTVKLYFEEGVVPGLVVEGMNDKGTIGWFGPCPPSGVHRYVFELFALDAALDLDEGSTKDQFREALAGHVLEKTTLTGLYEKKPKA